MSLQRKVALASALIAGLAAPLHAAEPKPEPCAAASRYAMPDGVETLGQDKGVAPADLPGSRAGFALPPKIGFHLTTNPLASEFAQSDLYLGYVEIDRESGRTTIDGQPLSDRTAEDAPCSTVRIRVPDGKTDER